MSFKNPSLVYSNNCFKCYSEFAFWKGRFRYHCRCCGNNFCYNCLPNYCALPQIAIWKDVRTCDTCYEKYTNHTMENKPTKTETETETDDDDVYFDPTFHLRHNEQHVDVADSFENIHLDDEQFKQEENAQYLSVHEGATVPGSEKETTPTSSNIIDNCIDNEMQSNIFTVNPKSDSCELQEAVDDRQLKIALSLSRIENTFLKYTTSKETTTLSEQEEIQYALRLSALEEKAKIITSRLEISNQKSKTMSEDEELSLAIAISKIENEDAQSFKNQCETPPHQDKTNKNDTKSQQMHCPICFEERLEYALIECGHVVCGDCKPKLEECPICRAVIRGAIRVYITN